MNKIYKVVWSKVRNAYVVVSELAKRNSKTKSQHTARVSHSLLSLAVVSSLALGLVSMDNCSDPTACTPCNSYK